MPRDKDNDNDSHRGRRDGPTRGAGPRKSGGPKSAGPKRAGPRSDGPRRAGPRSDGPKREGAWRDGPRREGAKREGGWRDGAKREGAKREGGKREGAWSDGPRREGAKREGARPAGAKTGVKRGFAGGRSGSSRDDGPAWQKRERASGGDQRRERFSRDDADGRSRPRTATSRTSAGSSGRPPRSADGGDRRPRGEGSRQFDRPRSFSKRDDAHGEGRGAPRRGRSDRDGAAPGRERGERPRFGRGEEGEGRHAAPRPRRSGDDRPGFGRSSERRGAGEFEKRPRRSFDRGEERGQERRDYRRGEDRDRPPPRHGRSDDRPARSGRDGSERHSEGEFERRPRRNFDRGEDGFAPGRGSGRGEGRFRDWSSERARSDDGEDRARRPAFGGRGAYRERGFAADADVRGEEPKEKKTGERIAKVLARAGIASRRNAEVMITQGRVTVNGRTLNSPALDVGRDDVITVDGTVVPPRERTRLFLYHKPRGLMTTHSDPEGRPTVFDQLPAKLPRVISIGRLDFNTEGLLLLTNDGGLARVLELPDTGWLRRYRVRAHGEITQARLDALSEGIEVDGVRYGPIEATLERNQGANVWMLFAIREGKNREVRNVLSHLGLEVNRLIRVSYGPFQLGELAEGEVEEVKPRVLREQLGDKVIARAGADFEGPRRDGEAGGKPPVRKSAITDRKGRRVVVQRSGNEDDNRGGSGPPRRPKRGYHGKRDVTPRE